MNHHNTMDKYVLKEKLSGFQKSLFIEKLKILYQNLLLSIPASFLCATIIFIGLYNSHNNTSLLVWYGAVLIVSLLRLLSFIFKQIEQVSSLPLFIIGTVVSGILWGICASALMPQDLIRQMIVVVIIAGVTAGGVQTLQASFIASCLYIAVIIIPLIVWLFMNSGYSYFILGVAMTIYLCFMLITALRGSKALEQSLQLRYENAGLVKSLSDTNQELLRSYHTIEEKLVELQQREVEMRYVNRVNEMLQTCQKSSEAYSIISRSSEELFPELSGGIVIFETPSQSRQIKQWGEHRVLKENFSQEDCWALREGRPYIVNDKRNNLVCNHFNITPPGGYICLPQILQTGVMGVLVLCASEGDIITLHQEQLATIYNDTIKLSLANIHLREILSEQSIHDPLTQLYNRRFLDETLPRELMRTVREKTHLCIVMIDVDFFKYINDTSGHEAGDIILKYIGKQLEENFRGGDIACRFGGDEFILVLVDSTIKAALPRIEFIRETIKNAQLFLRDHLLPQVTISIGMAEAPTHGTELIELMRAADEALYQAKNAGRDRIEVFYKK